MMKSLPVLVALCLVLVSACAQHPSAGGASPAATAARDLPAGEHVNPAYTTVQQMMRAKLAHAQAVLEGVATNRMDQVEANANALLHLSELTQWEVHRTLEYGVYSDEFRTNVRELARHARAKQLHAATLDYMQLTMSCVRCHDYMSQSGLVKRIDLQSLMAMDGR